MGPTRAFAPARVAGGVLLDGSGSEGTHEAESALLRRVARRALEQAALPDTRRLGRDGEVSRLDEARTVLVVGQEAAALEPVAVVAEEGARRFLVVGMNGQEVLLAARVVQRQEKAILAGEGVARTKIAQRHQPQALLVVEHDE